jgi:hypothetical protein
VNPVIEFLTDDTSCCVWDCSPARSRDFLVAIFTVDIRVYGLQLGGNFRHSRRRASFLQVGCLIDIIHFMHSMPPISGRIPLVMEIMADNKMRQRVFL